MQFSEVSNSRRPRNPDGLMHPQLDIESAPPAATITKAKPAPAEVTTPKLDEFRAAYATATGLQEQVAGLKRSADALHGLETRIAECVDEAEALSLAKQLGEAQAEHTIGRIRESRVAESAKRAWEDASKLAGWALNEVSDLVGDATHGAWMEAHDALRKAVDPEVWAIAENSDRARFSIHEALNTLPSITKGVALANRVQRDLDTARHRAQHGESLEAHCRAVAATIESALGQVPEIRKQSAKSIRAFKALAEAVE